MVVWTRVRRRTVTRLAVAVVSCWASTSAATSAQSAESGYRLPPDVVVDILDAAPAPTALVSPNRQVVALIERTSMPRIAELAEPMLRLAGARVNPRTNGPHGGITTHGLVLKHIGDGRESRVSLPAGARLSGVEFSPDGRWLSFLMTGTHGIELWLANAATAEARVLTGGLNGLAGCEWLDDSRGLLCGLVPAGRPPAPPTPLVPTGPRVQESLGMSAPAATYQDLLTSAHDETLFDYYFTAQLAIVDTAGAKTPIGAPAVFDEFSASPDGQHVLVSRIRRPYSRLVPADGFPKTIEVWDLQGKVRVVIGDQPSSEGTPIGGVTTGPRSARWVQVEPATVVWVEAMDGGNPRARVAYRDRVLTAKAPFTGSAVEFVRTQWRFGSVQWTQRGVAFVSESDRPTRMVRTWVIDAAGATPRKWLERRSADRYADPGSPLSASGSSGRFGFRRPGGGRILQTGDSVFLTGAGASPKGDRPYLDRLNLKTLATERLFQCDEASYETVLAVLDDGGTRLLTRRESKTEFPNLFVRDLKAGTQVALTRFVDPAPQLGGIQKQLVTYVRKDGVRLSATVYLPPGYVAGTRLPFVLWAYPAEFTDADTASQVSGSAHRYTTVAGASHLLFLTLGYGVMDNPSMPIVGAGETANDTYVEQLVASAEAAVDTIVEMGVADRDRIGVAGHSYGAFMTANLLAHSDVFRAGLARSGAYNRTLTPFGFQNEQRTFWQVPEVYGRMSPFFHADKVNEPILLVHGEADNNSGTFPIQSERFYMALKGHGATVRYVTLPLESHGYAARESVLHVMYEWMAWFDKYVKNAKPR